MLPRKLDFTLEMLCMRHMIPNQHTYILVVVFYSRLFDPDRGGNRATKLDLGTYLTPLFMTV